MTVSEPRMFVVSERSGRSTMSLTPTAAARCTTKSHSWTNSSTTSSSRTEPWTNRKLLLLPARSRFCRRPVDRLSNATTLSPRARRASTRDEPIKPAPPVTRKLRPELVGTTGGRGELAASPSGSPVTTVGETAQGPPELKDLPAGGPDAESALGVTCGGLPLRTRASCWACSSNWPTGTASVHGRAERHSAPSQSGPRRILRPRRRVPLMEARERADHSVRAAPRDDRQQGVLDPPLADASGVS
jgi:hypothetical protein